MTTAPNGHHFTVTIPTANADDNDALPPPEDNNNNNNNRDDEDDELNPDDPFDIAQTKNASHETLRRWRVIISLFLFLFLFIYFLLNALL